MPESWRTLKVVSKTAEAEDVTSFELADPNGAPLEHFSAGAHIDVEVKPGLVRQYSLCNDAREPNRYLIAVLREPASRGGSSTLTDAVQVGAELRVGAPRNLFALDPAAERVVLMAGGIGITPILCMAERLAVVHTPFEMHYCARSLRRTAFFDRIQSSAFADRVHFHFDEAPATLIDMADAVKQKGERDHLYVCGPSGFINAVMGAAASAGWDPLRLHREYFAAAAAVAEAQPGQNRPFEIELASSGARFTVPADRSVIEVLAENGVEVPMSCEQGICGTCLTRVLSGVPYHRDSFMTDQEHVRNDKFTPCCSRSKTDLLVLDL
ncbi:PDR/VanB family oxidoreductase [Methylocella tundrae]|uniref:Vanillate O-demethylase oxidoreductase n=1 Tax=Methylocella tundrae TaxID=227605 RepID=A0A4U8Z7Y5_METTU|nr:PDR/VanB family oxidoreductase [Methylocella tundrae]WPP02926.1 PDR/VanB family oxidoreductase [Methylocella tundrae]VFU16578.1 Vanillate O-demethylase oxidoreductase [Methylocella tundrae]